MRRLLAWVRRGLARLMGGTDVRPHVARVLVVGGSSTYRDAETYDPATGQWTVTAGPFGAERSAAHLILLPTGRVLLVGGQFPHISRNCELYDPGTGEWYATGKTLVDRNFGNAVSLADGRVLLIGGYETVGGSNVDLRSVEIYDPATQAWTQTGELIQSRYGHTATLLPNGEVLVVGGAQAASHPTAELYDPVTGQWGQTSGPFHNRTGHTATLLPNGKVLVAGGLTHPSYTETDSVEVYDVATGNWYATGKLVTKRRYNHTATTLQDGRVLLVGGYNETEGPLDHVEIYDPGTQLWDAAGTTTVPRSAHTATLLPDGRVLVVGGDTVSGNVASKVASAELFDPATSSWTSTGTLHTGRALHSASLFDVKDLPLPVG